MELLRQIISQHSLWECRSVGLVLALIVYLILLAIGRRLKRRMGLPLGLSYQTAAAATGLYLATILIEPNLVLRREFGAVAVLTGVRALLPLVNWIFMRRLSSGTHIESLPKFLREVLSLFIFVVTVLLVLQYSYQIQIPGLIAGSGIAALAIGLAAQDLLANIIGGFTLHFACPFRVHDWIFLDGQHVQVVEINWRSTRFRNNDNTRFDVPNSHIVKQTIVNYYGHDHQAQEFTRPHALRLEVGIDYLAPPNRVKALLAEAAAQVPQVLPMPAPDAFLKDFGDSSIVYEVRYWIDDHTEQQRIADQIRTNIWYTLGRNDIKIPFPIRTLQLERRPTAEAARHAHRHADLCVMLRKQPVFAALSTESLHYLLDNGPERVFGCGERIITENAAGDSMFIITSGRAAVMIGAATTGSTQVTELTAGQFFGEMSLLTGEPRSATVQAITDCEILEITKPMFCVIMEREENLLSRLSELLATRKLDTEGFASRLRDESQSAATDLAKEYKAKLRHKIRAFFEL